MGKGSEPPPPPNYQQIATDQGEADKAALAQQTWANRPTQVTPWGRMDWATERGTDPATGAPITEWTQTQSLNPALQGALENQFGVGAGRAELASGMFGRVGDAFAQSYDPSGLRGVSEVQAAPELRRQAEDAMYLRATSRLDPQFAEREQALEIDLRNKGLRPGDEAYDAAMANFGRERSDAYAMARADATTAGRAEAAQMFGQQQSQQAQSAALRQQQMAEELQLRGMPLEEVNMLLAGQGVQPPSQPGVTYSGLQRPVNMMGAAQMGYNAAADRWSAEQAQRQSTMSGLFGLGSTAIGMFCDRRLKTNVRRIGTWRGYPVYAFNYVWGAPAIGVMADEVNEDAVFTHSSGFAMVDYARVR